ncbi:hypothetical protein H7J07_17115 [Mycobacterium koreense]|uniref:Uncharacterized protein n=1 Tax=Mycolicibacillus koreensis TaxID=1069220 RepID=A0A7I7SCS1_9MYCO|nr:hypothetical protein [Mycolicibacillus koreensis]MCV7249923.1 hypothetical protein [Mycolicibacillus koreensis]OSC34859.1 hypothetical protein B8W67_04875 [Mycolicibacillus koreensis]BBY54722.1 hypothetical protein MKOR_19730 [Mycolicibacillus koreensis]
MSELAPEGVRKAGFVVAGEGALALIAAAVLVVRGLAGADQSAVNGFGTAAWFVLVGAVVTAGGVALVRGHRWGRGIAVFTQLLLLPVAWYVAVGSHQWGYGITVAVVALGVLALLFSPAAVAWAAGSAQSGGSGDAANPASAGPESR